MPRLVLIPQQYARTSHAPLHHQTHQTLFSNLNLLLVLLHFSGGKTHVTILKHKAFREFNASTTTNPLAQIFWLAGACVGSFHVVPVTVGFFQGLHLSPTGSCKLAVDVSASRVQTQCINVCFNVACSLNGKFKQFTI